MVVVVLGIAMILLLRISLQPVYAVSAGARLLGAGDLSLRLPPPQVAEFEGVVVAFNRMAGQLESTRNDLLDANRELESRVRDRTTALEGEHRRRLAAERLSTLGLLSSAIAHDLRNPLNTIGLAAQSLELRLEAGQDEKVAERLATIRRELARAERIIRTLLGFARTGEPVLQPTDVNSLVREVVGVIDAPEIVDVRLDLEPEMPAVPVDRDQLFQVLENLIRNAIQVMYEGGRVAVATRTRDGRCLVSVQDTGPGVPEELQAEIFEPLVTTRSTGTGLGLALAKRIVEAHGGRIWLESAVGAGATFRIELPVGD
jgi:two-component system NtrC family sensor kinase